MLLGAYVLPMTEPCDPIALARATAGYIDESGLSLNRITASGLKGNTKKFRSAIFAELCAASTLTGFTLWNEHVDTTSLEMHLRDFSSSKLDAVLRTHEQRQGHVIAATLPLRLTGALRALLLAVAAQNEVAHGFLAGFERYGDAREECMVSGSDPRDPDPSRRERLRVDERSFHVKYKLRRLYPITIIGPAIWAQLPPMPAFDPMPTVEELGDCKIVTAWPELCDPRDPAFLRGTRALREWLWPYTIQNPADHVDNDPPCADVAT